ncbi:MAG: hypothetical protein LUG98_10465 [Tannerellaceae bacterium]|nr:hypothetical protein [Tannerellaceae bacterium]
MKFKTFSLAAMAALLFTACDKEDVGIPDFNDNDQDTKSVFLKFDASTRSSRSIEGSAEGTVAELNSAMIYFLNGNNESSQVYAVKEVSGNTSADITLDDLKKGHEFTKIPEAVSFVYVVGNFEAGNLPKGTGMTFEKLQSTVLNIENVNKGDKLGTVLDGIASVKPYRGNESGWGTGSTTPGEDDYYANVTVSPINARIEIKELNYTGEELSAFTVEGIYINYYYSNLPLSLNTVNAGSVFVNNGSDVQKYDQNSPNFAYTDYTTLFDQVGITPTLTPDGDKNKATVGAGDNKFWSYHVFGECTPAHIVIKFTDLVDKDGKPMEGDRYITVGGFQKGEAKLEQLNRGTIYQLPAIPFSDEHLEVIPEPGDISIWVKVTVAPWEIEIVSPII